MPAEAQWLDLEQLAAVELTSEDAYYPVENALVPGGQREWRAQHAGTQGIRIIFDEPQRLRRIRLLFSESQAERTQEFVLSWSSDNARSFHPVVRQQWNFSPEGSTVEAEDYRVDLAGVTALDLRITPDVRGGDAIASLTEWRVA
jgi:hypothetical protein